MGTATLIVLKKYYSDNKWNDTSPAEGIAGIFEWTRNANIVVSHYVRGKDLINPLDLSNILGPDAGSTGFHRFRSGKVIASRAGRDSLHLKNGRGGAAISASSSRMIRAWPVVCNDVWHHALPPIRPIAPLS